MFAITDLAEILSIRRWSFSNTFFFQAIKFENENKMDGHPKRSKTLLVSIEMRLWTRSAHSFDSFQPAPGGGLILPP
jgi:hypothetical protein